MHGENLYLFRLMTATFYGLLRSPSSMIVHQLRTGVFVQSLELHDGVEVKNLEYRRRRNWVSFGDCDAGRGRGLA
jgi:hypothetical protein